MLPIEKQPRLEPGLATEQERESVIRIRNMLLPDKSLPAFMSVNEKLVSSNILFLASCKKFS